MDWQVALYGVALMISIGVLAASFQLWGDVIDERREAPTTSRDVSVEVEEPGAAGT